MHRGIIFGGIWFAGMVGGMLAALSDDNWAERLAARCGDDPYAGGRALRFFVMCFGTFIVPTLCIAIWEIIARGGG